MLFKFSQWTGGCLQLQVGPAKNQIVLYWYIYIFICGMTQGKIDLRNESGRPMKVKVVGEVSEK